MVQSTVGNDEGDSSVNVNVVSVLYNVHTVHTYLVAGKGKTEGTKKGKAKREKQKAKSKKKKGKRKKNYLDSKTCHLAASNGEVGSQFSSFVGGEVVY